MAFAGGCLCGRVRYTVEGEPNFAAVCHCRSCQRYTGSAFEPVMVFPSQAVQVKGDLKTYDDVGDSGIRASPLLPELWLRRHCRCRCDARSHYRFGWFAR